LFKYGFKIDYNLIKDLQSNYIRVQSSINDQDPVTRVLPWYYFPLLSASSDHFITRGLNYIKTEFVSAIDTTPAPMPDVQRTVLLSSSDTSALIRNPAYISMDEITQAPDPGVFRDANLPVAILSEGSFSSFYTNYGIPEGVNMGGREMKVKSDIAMVFVAGDGDMIRNEVDITEQDTVPLPLGYDKDTRQIFGNKDFILNVVNYMTDDEALISLRAREFKLRLLDRGKIRFADVRLKWQLINSLLPVILVLIFGGIFAYTRKIKYRNTK
jgi:gliding-associated putative ABC transporter substrate-binding component GldG